ncbi:NUDIX hydrolase [Planctomyces sp. SH-PL62]|uniref:NUDIX hydrolase n=1 Tax=Planctomyces sp. SH-PL62 TaxID=1636152 RepID=UPI00078CB054|nr:NUDIX hydrolase [Planctomyces sp. SH-PL62]AMV38419.1 ADP-ribose pyrophosphatase [Planctomyces sp. SH-PL62]
MERHNGPWTILDSEEEYKDDFIEVVRDDVRRPDGQLGAYATVTMKPGVAVLVVDEDGTVVLTRQFRYALGRDSVEVVSGGVDEGEEPLAAARREAKEELGIQAERWDDLGRIDLDTSIVRSPVSLFMARELSWTETEQEGTEEIEPVKASYAEAIRMIEDGTIMHAPTCVLLLKARAFVESTSAH